MVLLTDRDTCLRAEAIERSGQAASNSVETFPFHRRPTSKALISYLPGYGGSFLHRLTCVGAAFDVGGVSLTFQPGAVTSLIHLAPFSFFLLAPRRSRRAKLNFTSAELNVYNTRRDESSRFHTPVKVETNARWRNQTKGRRIPVDCSVRRRRAFSDLVHVCNSSDRLSVCCNRDWISTLNDNFPDMAWLSKNYAFYYTPNAAHSFQRKNRIRIYL